MDGQFLFKSTSRYLSIPMPSVPVSQVINGQIVTTYLSQSVIFQDHTFVTDNAEIAQRLRKSKAHGELFWEVVEESETPAGAPEDTLIDGVKTKNDALNYLIKQGATADELKPLKSKADVAAFAQKKYHVVFADFVSESAE